MVLLLKYQDIRQSLNRPVYTNAKVSPNRILSTTTVLFACTQSQKHSFFMAADKIRDAFDLSLSTV